MAYRTPKPSRSVGRNNRNQNRFRRRKGRRSNRRTRRRGRGMFYVETFSFSTTAASLKVTVKQLTNRPKSSNFRVRYIQVIASISSPSGFAIQPATIDIRIQNSAVGDGSYVAATGPVLLGSEPKSVRVHTPRSSDWLAYNEADTVALGEIVIGCIEKGATVKVSGLCHILVDFGPELLPQTCPALVPQHLEAEPVPGTSGAISSPSLSQLEIGSDDE